MVFPEKHKAFAQGFYFFVSLQKGEANIRGNKFCANKQVKETKVRKFIVFENRLFPLFVRTFCCLKKKLFLKLFFVHGAQESVKKKLFRLRIYFLLLVYLKRAYNQDTKRAYIARINARINARMNARAHQCAHECAHQCAHQCARMRARERARARARAQLNF